MPVEALKVQRYRLHRLARLPMVAVLCAACAAPVQIPPVVINPFTPLPAAPPPAPWPIPPRLSVTPAEEAGMNQASLDSLDVIIRDHLARGAAPGASIAIGRHGRLVKLQGYGLLDARLQFGSVNDSTLYDLASLTKVIGTTTAVMLLVDAGMIDLDAPVYQYIPEWEGNPTRDAVTVRNLLLHNSGLAAGGNLYRTARGPASYRSAIARSDLVYPPGTRTVYSDYGAILLGAIVEQVSGQTLDAFLHDRLFAPLGMTDTGFNPLQWASGTTLAVGAADTRPEALPPSSPLLKRIAPTEWDSTFRARQMQGIVHDENAYAMGGVAGHAGLFSSARDLAIFAQLMLNRGTYGGRRFIEEATVRQFTQRASALSSRALGWDTPTANSSNGQFFTASSFGHTGFTGTSLWIDPERDVYVVLLTNRVNPTRSNQKHLPLRIDVADQVQRAIADMPVYPRVDPPRAGGSR
jgi:CubicO group peptidase (beta-lactamase class C family)